MKAKSKGLGKGLAAFFPSQEKAESTKNAVINIPLNKITCRRDQPRKNFSEDSLLELATSIKNYGLLQPVIVKKEGEKYLLLAGERRFRASKIAKLEAVPALVKEYTREETYAVALIENLQREDLNVMEEALAYESLGSEFNLSPAQIGEKIGKSRPYIKNILRLLDLPHEIKLSLAKKEITQGQVRPLLSLPTVDLQLDLFLKIVEENLSARQVENLVKSIILKSHAPREKSEDKGHLLDADEQIFFKDLTEKLEDLFLTKVNIHRGKKKNRLEIEFYTEDDLKRILDILATRKEDERSSATHIEKFSV